jgi:hypothetical protein
MWMTASFSMCYYSCIIYSSIWQWPELNRSMWYLFYVLPQLSTILFFFPVFVSLVLTPSRSRELCARRPSPSLSLPLSQASVTLSLSPSPSQAPHSLPPLSLRRGGAASRVGLGVVRPGGAASRAGRGAVERAQRGRAGSAWQIGRDVLERFLSSPVLRSRRRLADPTAVVQIRSLAPRSGLLRARQRLREWRRDPKRRRFRADLVGP